MPLDIITIRRRGGYFTVPSIVTPPYAGPADTVASPSAFWGLRAVNLTAANAGVAAINITNGVPNTGDIHVTSTGGINLLDPLILAGGPFTVNTVYDQVSTRHITISNVSLVLNVFHGLPVFRFDGVAQLMRIGSAPPLLSQPFTVSLFYKTINTAARQDIFASVGGGICQCLTSGAADDIRWNCGSPNAIVTTAPHDGDFHALQCVAQSTGDLNVDGVADPTASFGTNDLSAATDFVVGDAQISTLFPFKGDLMEIGLWPVGFSSANSTAMSNNQHGFYGS